MIKRIDLRRDYQKHQAEYLAAIQAVCAETAFSGGKFADRFDREFAAYCEVPYAAGVNNGTSALHVAMLALGIGAGDEVIVPANTFIATAWGVSYTGAMPVFVDCTPDTWQLDPDRIEKAITAKTKAIIGVHLYGQPFEFDQIKAIATKYNLYLVEDCAQAHGALYQGRKVGSLGDMGCFSFYPGKNLYAFGEGGSVTSHCKDYIDYINVLKNQGSAVAYYHDVVGYNMRLEGLQGAVLSVSLKYLDEWTRRRRELAAIYHQEITNPAFTMQVHPANTTPVHHLFVVTTEKPLEFIAYMADREIECHRHYPVPCHLQKAYAHLSYRPGDCPNAEYLAAHCVTLPLFPEMTDAEAAEVISACNAYVLK
jgi:dTDP-4-amino-4,6-dideoxygalactose transaminase